MKGLTYLLFLCLITGTASAYDNSEYEWVEYKGRKVKKWKISNKEFRQKAVKPNRELASVSVEGASGDIDLSSFRTDILINAGLGFKQFEVMDKVNSSNGNFASESHYHLKFETSFKNEDFEYIFSTGMRSLKIKSGENAAIKDNSITVKRITTGLRYGQRFSVGLFFNYSDFAFIDTKGQVFSLISTSLPSANLDFDYKFYQNPNWEMGSRFSYEHIGSGKEGELKVETGSSIELGLYGVRKLKNKRFQIGITANQRTQNTNKSEQKELGVLMNAAVTFEF